MINKLIITESQYDKLSQFINETRFDKVMKNTIQVGDVVRIGYKNSVSNFKVIDSIGGQVKMDNIDSGSTNINYRYFMSMNSLDGNKLEVRRVHKLKEKDKLEDIKLWQVVPVNDIKNIEVIRGGTVIDKVDEPQANNGQKPKEKPQSPYTDDIKTKLSDVLFTLISRVDEGNGVKLELNDGSIIDLCCIGKSNNSFNFEAGINTNKDLQKWDSFIIKVRGSGDDEQVDLYELNKTIITSTDNGETFDLVFEGNRGDNTGNVTISNIKNLVPTDSCEVNQDKEKEIGVEKDAAADKAEAEAMMKEILNDPLMKKAFYSQPTLWNLIVAAVKGKNPKGTGIGPARNILAQYGEARVREKLGESGNNFSTGKKAQFVMINKVNVNTGNPKTSLDMKPNITYEAMVNEYKRGDTNYTLTNDSMGINITILKSIGKSDTFEVTIEKFIRKKGEVQKFKPVTAIIKFINKRGSGYSKENTKTK